MPPPQHVERFADVLVASSTYAAQHPGRERGLPTVVIHPGGAMSGSPRATRRASATASRRWCGSAVSTPTSRRRSLFARAPSSRSRCERFARASALGRALMTRASLCVAPAQLPSARCIMAGRLLRALVEALIARIGSRGRAWSARGTRRTSSRLSSADVFVLASTGAETSSWPIGRGGGHAGRRLCARRHGRVPVRRRQRTHPERADAARARCRHGRRLNATPRRRWRDRTLVIASRHHLCCRHACCTSARTRSVRRDIKRAQARSAGFIRPSPRWGGNLEIRAPGCAHASLVFSARLWQYSGLRV